MLASVGGCAAIRCPAHRCDRGSYLRPRRSIRSPRSAFKDQAGGCPMDEQVRDTSFRSADPAATTDDCSSSLDRASVRRDRSNKEILNSRVVEPRPFSKVEWIARPMQLSSIVAARPPCTVPAGLGACLGLLPSQRHALSPLQRCRNRASWLLSGAPAATWPKA